MRSFVLSSTSARLQWNTLNCLDTNGPIEGYTVRYALRFGGDEEFTVTTFARDIVIDGLSAGQEYSISVAAVNSVGRGPFSEPIFLVLIGKCCTYKNCEFVILRHITCTVISGV